MDNLPNVSIIIPTLNESNHILECLLSISRQDFDHSLITVFIVDGGSVDSTLNLIKEYQSTFAIKILQNPKVKQNFGFNSALDHVQSKYVMRFDGHATISSNYLSTCVSLLEDNFQIGAVGGIMKTVPSSASLISKSISVVLSSRFGVGNSKFRTSVEGNATNFIDVDTVPFSLYRTSAIKSLGGYDLRLHNSEDIDLNRRLVLMNYRVVMHSDILSFYYSRSTFSSFIIQSFRNGFWSIYPILIGIKSSFSIRHFIPFFFVTYLFITFFSVPNLLLLFPLFLYVFILSIYSINSFLIFKNFGLTFLIFLTYPMLHISYGLGSISAIPLFLYRWLFKYEFY